MSKSPKTLNLDTKIWDALEGRNASDTINTILLEPHNFSLISSLSFEEAKKEWLDWALSELLKEVRGRRGEMMDKIAEILAEGFCDRFGREEANV